MYSIYIQYKSINKKISKAGAALVDTISSLSHFGHKKGINFGLK